MSAHLEAAFKGFHPLSVLRWALRLARPLVKLSGPQSAAWDVVQSVVDLAGEPARPERTET